MAILSSSLPGAIVAGGTANAVISSTFGSVYSANATGDVVIRGNTLMTCPAATAGCTAAVNTAGGGATTNANLNNNNWTMGFVDVDADPTTFDSSSATLTLPTGASVLYAGLVWGGDTAAETGGVVAPTVANYNKVVLKAPGATTYQNITAGWTAGSSSSNYEGYSDVTAAVQAAGSGSYTVGNVQSGTGANGYAGWALVVAVRDPTQPLRNLTVFRGYGSIASGESVNIPVSGFTTPPSGAVKTTLGAVSWEGDLGSIGDAMKLGPSTSSLTSVSDALHAPTNLFDSTISDKGVDDSTRNPSYPNQLGFDAATFDVSGLLPNAATSADIQLTSTSETYYPGVVTFATDLYSPKITSTKTVALTKASGNSQAGIVEPGDTLTYTINNTDDGSDTASSTVLTDTAPAGTTYVPNSMTLGGTSLTDASDADVGKVSAGTLTVNLGTGATGSAGGSVAPTASTAALTFKVTVNPGITDGASIVNTAQVSYLGLTSGESVTGSSNTVSSSVVLHRSNLSLTKVADHSLVQKGAGTSVGYTLTGSNAGPYDDPHVVITDTLPAGAVVGAVTPSSGTCSVAGRVVTCHVGTVVNGGTATVTVAAVVDASADPATDVATVTGDNIDDTTADEAASASTAVNTAPVAVADSATTAGGTMTVDAVLNDTDADGDALHLSAVAAPSHGTVVITAGKAVYTAAAGWAGPDSFTYTVADARGGTATGTVSITVPNANPVAVADAGSTTPGSAVDIPVLGNDTDPNIPAVPAQVLSLQSVTQPSGSAGTVTISGTNAHFVPSSTFLHGSTTFGYTVADGAGGTATATVTVTMANVSPAAAADSVTTASATAVDADVLANDSDANGDTLTVTAVVGAAHGTASIVTVGGVTEVHYVPNAGWAGPDTMTYTVSDGTLTSTAVLTVTTANAPPVATGFSATIAGATPTTLVVLGHATDANGDTLSVTGTSTPAHGSVVVHPNGDIVYTPTSSYAGPDSFTYTVSDGNGGSSTATVSLTVSNQAPTAVHDDATVPVNGSVLIDVLANDTDPNADPMTVSIITAPSHGTVVIHPDQTLTYTPAPGFEGADTFHYGISDGHGGSDTATVTVTVANDPPTPVADTAIATGTAGSPITIDVLANDTDPNGDPLTLVTVGAAAHGTTAIVGTEIVYTPSALYTGPDSFGYTVSDGRGGLGGTTVTVDVRNRNPLANPDTATVLANRTGTIDVLANDTDPDGEPLAIFTVATPSAHGGTVSITSDGLVRYVPAAGYDGTDTFSYVVTDPRAGHATGIVNVTVVNAPPIATDDTATLPAGPAAPLLVDVLANDIDPNGDPLTIRSVSQPANGTVTIVGGELQYVPSTDGFVGTDTFSYTVSDGQGGLDTATVTVTGINHDPTAAPVTGSTGTGTPVSINLSGAATDVDGQPLAFTFVGMAAGARVTVSGTTLTYTPAPGFAGTDTFRYTVDDGHGGTASSTVTVGVSDAAPVTVPATASVPYGQPVAVNVLASATDANIPGSTQGLTVTHLSVDAAKATATVAADGTVNVVPAAGFVGSVVVGFDVEDGAGGVTPSTLTVVVVAPTPVARPDGATTPYQQAISLDVLANDSSGTAYSSVVSLVAGGTLLPVDDHLTVQGTVTVSGGRLLYTPPARFIGSVTFTYAMVNALGGRASAQVGITVSAPVQQTTRAISLASGDNTGELDPSTLPGVSGTATVVGIVQPGHGATLSLVNGKIDVHRVAGFVGTVSGAVVLVDSTGTRTTVTVTIHLLARKGSATGPPPPAAAGSEPSVLPFTGAVLAPVAATGVLLLLVGIFLVRRARRIGS